MNVAYIDSYGNFGKEITAAAIRRGWPCRAATAHDTPPGGVLWTRLSMTPTVRAEEQKLHADLAPGRILIADQAQVDVYEDKVEQWRRWSDLMPESWLFESEEEALEFAAGADYPLVSKSAEGSASHQVWFLYDERAAAEHIRARFRGVIALDHGATQTGYVFLQRFIPHNRTFRGHIVGNGMLFYARRNHSDRPAAKLHFDEPIYDLALIDRLCAYTQTVRERLGTNWCAIDILDDDGEMRMLETSLGFMFPRPPWLMQTPIIGAGGTFGRIFDTALDEVERGVFGAAAC